MSKFVFPCGCATRSQNHGLQIELCSKHQKQIIKWSAAKRHRFYDKLIELSKDSR